MLDLFLASEQSSSKCDISARLVALSTLWKIRINILLLFFRYRSFTGSKGSNKLIWYFYDKLRLKGTGDVVINASPFKKLHNTLFIKYNNVILFNIVIILYNLIQDILRLVVSAC